MTNPIIEVNNLVFDYPGFRALHGVSLSIAPGTVTALVGPNGAGKTTLLRCIAALDTPLSGTVRMLGLDVHESPREAHRMMGYLSDNFGLYGDLTVAQSLDYAARSNGLAAQAVADAVQTTAKRIGLNDMLHKLAGTLSRGQRQRLAIGQAIIHTPQLLLLDEPASGLDPEARSSLAQVFLQLQAQGMSLLVSSHILAELDEYSTHMLALNEGRVLEHRALVQHSHAEGRTDAGERMLRLECLEPVQALTAWLADQAGVRVQNVETHALEVGLVGTLAVQAELIAACVAAGHRLTVIAPISENLQQSYLKSLQASRATQPSLKAVP